MRAEMESEGGQEVRLPVVHPRELWEASGRFQSVDSTLVRFKDRTGHAMVLAMTHEEAVTDLAKAFVHSARQLPLLIFQIQTKFRDEPRARGGLVRRREFLMKDAYSFHASREDLDTLYDQVLAAYLRTSPLGERTRSSCAVPVAMRPTGRWPPRRRPRAVREVATPGADTMEALAQRYGWVPDARLKTVYRLTAGGRTMVALIRGDREVNEVKLGRVVGEPILPLGSERRRAGAHPRIRGTGPGTPPRRSGGGRRHAGRRPVGHRRQPA